MARLKRLGADPVDGEDQPETDDEAHAGEQPDVDCLNRAEGADDECIDGEAQGGKHHEPHAAGVHGGQGVNRGGMGHEAWTGGRCGK